MLYHWEECVLLAAAGRNLSVLVLGGVEGERKDTIVRGNWRQVRLGKPTPPSSGAPVWHLGLHRSSARHAWGCEHPLGKGNVQMAFWSDGSNGQSDEESM